MREAIENDRTMKSDRAAPREDAGDRGGWNPGLAGRSWLPERDGGPRRVIVLTFLGHRPELLDEVLLDAHILLDPRAHRAAACPDPACPPWGWRSKAVWGVECLVGYDEGGRGCGEVSAEKLIVARFRLHPSANFFLPHYPTLPPFELTSVPGSRLPPRRVHYSEVQYTRRQTPNQPARGRYGQLLEGLRRRVRRMMSSREAPSGPVRLPSARTPQSRPHRRNPAFHFFV